MRFLLLLTCALLILVSTGCVSDVPSDRRIKNEVEDYYKELESFNRKPTRIQVLEVIPTGSRVIAVADVEGKIIHQVHADAKKTFAARHDLVFQWIRSTWICTKNIPTDYNK
ncbi:MAG: hypothetical protein ACYS8W_00230 [Planctomycetota bacterium]|jgi:hypothetical protein